ncbi:hypothetical protein LRS10_13225 [Phenylobacterium sp. J426]|nr:hypothetical protein [Phenylobacterium sp. J426]MCR5875058.1 hypothetical protein [Phenylobacterium sp. J426]
MTQTGEGGAVGHGAEAGLALAQGHLGARAGERRERAAGDLLGEGDILARPDARRAAAGEDERLQASGAEQRHVQQGPGEHGLEGPGVGRRPGIGGGVGDGQGRAGVESVGHHGPEGVGGEADARELRPVEGRPLAADDDGPAIVGDLGVADPGRAQPFRQQAGGGGEQLVRLGQRPDRVGQFEQEGAAALQLREPRGPVPAFGDIPEIDGEAGLEREGAEGDPAAGVELGRHLGLARPPAGHDAGEEGAKLAAGGHALGHVAPDDASDDVLAAALEVRFGGPVAVGDAPVEVEGDEAFGEAVEDLDHVSPEAVRIGRSERRRRRTVVHALSRTCSRARDRSLSRRPECLKRRALPLGRMAAVLPVVGHEMKKARRRERPAGNGVFRSDRTKPPT